jgi:hypothetical protein
MQITWAIILIPRNSSRKRFIWVLVNQLILIMRVVEKLYTFFSLAQKYKLLENNCNICNPHDDINRWLT